MIPTYASGGYTPIFRHAIIRRVVLHKAYGRSHDVASACHKTGLYNWNAPPLKRRYTLFLLCPTRLRACRQKTHVGSKAWKSSLTPSPTTIDFTLGFVRVKLLKGPQISRNCHRRHVTAFWKTKLAAHGRKYREFRRDCIVALNRVSIRDEFVYCEGMSSKRSIVPSHRMYLT